MAVHRRPGLSGRLRDDQGRVELRSSRVGNEPGGVIVKNQMKRWGSCTKDGTLNLNWRIVTVPMSVVDCVAVHEFVHLRVQDHSREFLQKMRVVLPDYERRKEWLPIHGMTLEFSYGVWNFLPATLLDSL